MSSEAAEPWLQVYASEGFTTWMRQQRVSIACTTYQTGKLFLLGVKPDGQLAVHERTFNRAMGLFVQGESLWLGSLFQLWRFVNVLRPGQFYEGHDALYVPRVGYTTGDLDLHDVAVTAGGRVVCVNTKFSCLATLDERDSFQPLWQPSFISQLLPQDRCHLNGLALEAGQPRYVTAVSTTDTEEGWREHRHNGGVVLDVPTNTIVARGLSMPHAPRVHQGQLWVLNSGYGTLGRVDPGNGRYEPIAFCPGYLRGLALIGQHALVGLSRPRHDKTFGGLPLEDELARHGLEAICGLLVLDLRTGTILHSLRLEGMVTELYDVALLPEVVRPMAFGFKTEDIQRILTMGAPGNL